MSYYYKTTLLMDSKKRKRSLQLHLLVDIWHYTYLFASPNPNNLDEVQRQMILFQDNAFQLILTTINSVIQVGCPLK